MSQGPTPAPRRRWPLGPVVALVGVVVVALLVWWGVSAATPDEDAGTAAPESSEPAPDSAGPTDAGTASPSDAGTTASAEGCAPGGDGVPDDADAAEVVDVDGDGEADTAWLTPGPERAFGITTASGATFSAPVTSASPIRASAVVNVVGDDDDGEVPIALVDTGREVLLFSLAACAVTPTLNVQDEQFTFDKGFTGFGTGVGCTDVEGTLRLAGLDAVESDGTFTVTRTWIDLTADGRRASPGAEETVAEEAAPDDPVVTTAQETSCGDLVAGEDGPVEPTG